MAGDPKKKVARIDKKIAKVGVKKLKTQAKVNKRSGSYALSGLGEGRVENQNARINKLYRKKQQIKRKNNL